MAGKRASMREGPLAALFRKTEEEGLDGAPERSVREVEAPADPAPAESPRIPSPQERLRHAFSSDLPDNLLRAARASSRPPSSTATRGWDAARPGRQAAAARRRASAAPASTRSTA